MRRLVAFLTTAFAVSMRRACRMVRFNLPD